MARERSLLALALVCVLVHASHHLALAQTATAEIVISPEAQTDVLIGDTVLFTCVAYGDSVSTISWSRGGNDLMNDSQRVTIYEEEITEGGITFVQSILQICSVGLGDTTEGYSCSAGSDADVDSATFELNTQQILIYPEDTEVIAGDTVMLTCVSYQSPITWSQEGVELVNDSMRITVYQDQFEENGLSFYQSILQICSTESSDSGTYSCNADGGDRGNSSISFQFTVQTPPQIVLHPVDLTDVPNGDTVLLTCVAYGDLPLSISWSREGSTLMNDSQRFTIYEEEVEEGGIKFIQSILQICSMGTDDAGAYSCIAENEAGNDTANFELTVARAEAQIVLHPVNPTDVPDGDTVLLTCVAYGGLPLSISWSREGSILMNDSQRITIYEEEVEEGGITFIQSILQICSTEANDAGVYSCIAENEAGNDTATFQVTVTPPEVPVQIVLHPVDPTDVPDGDTVLLTCVAYGDLPLSISWSRDGSTLMNDSQRITIYQEEVEGGITFIQSILQICSTEANDAGVYSCIAENEAGNDTAAFELTVTPDEVPAQIVLHPVDPTDVPDGDTVLLTCVAYGDLPLSISWSRESSILMNDSQRITIYQEEVEEGGTTFIQSILQICSTETNDAGVYSCIAENEAGNDTATFELTVTPDEVPVQIVLHPMDPTDVPDGDTVLLTCVAYGDLPLSISWSRDGSTLMNDSQRVTIYEEEIVEGGITFIQSILQICSTEANDAGVYSCIAENEAGNDTATFQFTVTPDEVPAQIVLHPADPTDVPSGDTVLLTCVAYGDLPLSISWSRDGSTLMNDSQRITIFEQEVEEGGITFIQSILQICSTEANDAGVFSCIAKNEAGNDTANFEFTVSGAPAQIVIHPADLTDIPDGDTVLLTCVASGDLPLSISWSRDGSTLMNDSQRITIFEEEVEEGGITFIQSILQICSTETNDAGVYSCVAENEAGNDTATFELTVTPPEVPVQIVLHPADPTDVPDGDTVLLTCVAYGDLPLSISWSRDGNTLMNDSQRITIYEQEVEEGGITFIQSILQICSTEANDAGVYSCIAENEAGNDTANFELIVARAPAQIVLHPGDSTDVPDGDTVLLTCVAYGGLPLSIFWSREGSVLMNDSQRITIYQEEVEEGGITFIQSILQICSAEANDAGVYSCIAENEAGNDTTAFELTVTPPEVPVQIVLHPVDPTDVPVGDTVLLTCVAYGDLPLSISWSRDGSTLMNDSQRITIYEEEIEEGGITFIQSILQICSTEANDAGVYSCIAENDAGNDTTAFVLTVTPSEVPAQIVLHPVDPTDVPSGDTVLLTCVAYGDLPLSISWSRDGSTLMNDSQRITIYEEEVEEGGITFIQSILQICSTEANDAGSYSCTADNAAGNDTASFELTISEDEFATVVIRPTDTEVVAGLTTLLTCVGYGNPPVSITWRRFSTILTNDTSPRITIYEQEIIEDGVVFVVSILQICSTEVADTGLVSCTVENSIANDTAEFQFTVEAAAPQIVISPDDLTEVNSGDTVFLTCVVLGEPPLAFRWTREGRDLMNDSRVFIYDETFEEGGSNFVQSILQVCSTEESDSGEYSCVAESEQGNDTATFELDILVAPVIVIQPPPLTDVLDGNTVLLTCVAYGDLPLSISWSREGSTLMNDSQRITIYEQELEEGGITFIQSILQICSAESDDAGVYSCIAENDVDNVTANFELTVTPIAVPPQIVVQPEPITDVTAGQTVLFTCVAYGDQPLTISWSSEGSVLMNDSQRVAIYEEELEEGGIVFVQSILQICSAESDDAGVYSCIAENDVDNVTANFELTVTPIAVPPQIVVQPESITDVTAGQTVLFTCVAYGDQPLTISWSSEGSVLMNDSQRVAIYEEELEEGGIVFVQSILQICSAGTDDAGVYSCIAENDVDNVTANFELTVTPIAVPPQIVVQPEPITDVIAGQTVLFTCVAYGDQPLTISWSSEGSVLMNDSQRVAIYEEELEEGGIVFVQSILQICSAESDDAGVYSCSAENDVDNVTANFELTVTPIAIPPQIVVQPEPITDVIAGQTVLFTCVAYGDQPLTISWSSEGSVLMNDSQRVAIYEEELEEGGIVFVQSILQICSAESDDAGVYSCSAENDVDNVTANFELTVTPIAVPPQIVVQPEPITDVTAGQTVLFTCVAYGDQPLTISWSSEGSVLMNDSQRVAIYEEELEEGGIVFLQSILQICSAGTDDAGVYSCSAENDVDNVTANFELTVTPIAVPPQIVVQPEPITDVTAGQTVLFTCVAYGDQPLTISWSSEGNVLMNDSQRVAIYEEEFEEGGIVFVQSILQICSTGTDDAGIYTCVAENEIANTTASFEVTVSREAQLVLVPPNSEVPSGDTILLTCVASGSFPLDIYWSREGSALMNDTRVAIYQETFEESGLMFVMSILQLCSVETADGGTYSCTANNTFLNSTATFDLAVMEVAPQIVLAPPNSEVEATNTVLLTCVTYGDLPLSISWSRESSILMNDSQRITIYEEQFEENGITFIQSTLQICSTQIDDSGVYSCAAENRAGNNTSTFELLVTVAARVVALPDDSEVNVADTILLTCVGYSHPLGTIIWSRNNIYLMNGTRTVIYEEEFTENGFTFVSSTLQICSAESSDAGLYTCKVDNGITEASSNFSLTVISQVPVIALAPNDTIVTAGFSVALTCAAYGIPVPEISWSRRDLTGLALLEDTNATNITSESFVEGGVTFVYSTLVLCSSEVLSTAELSCTATNSIGSDTEYFTVSVESAVTIVHNPVPTIGFVDESASFTCTVMSSQSPSSFQWFRSGMTDPIADEGRYDISFSDADSMYTSQLIISDLEPADDGEYFCEVITLIHSTQFNVTTVSVPLTIYRIPVVEPISESPLLGIKGTTTTLQFSVSADALPPVTLANMEWQFNPITSPVVTLTADSSARYTFSSDMLTLNISGVVLSDEGTYSLIVSTVAGSDSADIHMFVRAPARIITAPMSTQASVGSSATFTCVAEGDPAPTFQWNFGGSTLVDDSKYDITATAPTVSTLTVLDVSSSDDGNYTCTATNDYGTDSASAGLQVLSVPVVAVVSSSPLIDAEGASVTLQFSISNDLPPVTSTDIVWLFTPVGSSTMQVISPNARYSFSDDMLSLTIGALTEMDEGSYTLEATTIAGSDSDTIFLDVQTASVITIPPVDTQALVGSSATFTCVAEAEPPPTFQWSFEGLSIADDSEYDITSTSTTSTLIVLDISPLDDGDYTCNATNDHGHDFASANLQVLSVPVVIPDSNTLIGVLGRSVTLEFFIFEDLPPVTVNETSWQFTSSVGSSTAQNITSASNVRYDFSDDMLSLTIGALTAMDEGSYTLEATTIAGSDSATITLDVQAPPVITTEPMDTQALVGSSATFVCVAAGEPTPTFQWSFGGLAIVDDDKYDVTATAPTVSTLTVLDVSPSDDGNYTCTATNDHGSDSASAGLQVLSAPVVAVVSSSPLIDAEGASVTLQFSISNDLPPVTSTDIVWLFTPVGSSTMQVISPNVRYTFSDDMLSLTIGALTAMDEGSYTLEATTIAGSDSDTIILDVQTASVITVPPVHKQALVGRSATFTCVAEAEPPPTFQWSFEGSSIADDSKYDITSTSTTSTLIVLDISPLDDGDYTCNATNDHGHDFASANLQVLSVPVVIPDSNSLIGVLGRSVTLEFFIFEDLPPVTVNETSWQFTPSVGSSTAQDITSASNVRYDFSDNMLSLTIGALTAMDEGSYTLEATTIAGSDSATIILDVQAPPVITTEPMDTQALVGSSATFVCVAEGEPTPTFQWSFGGLAIVDDDKYDITATAPTVSTLTVLDVSSSDDGNYTCTATNDHGSDSASAGLQVLSAPVVAVVSSSTLIDAEGASVTLQFSISNDLPPVTSTDIVWLFTPVGSSTMQVISPNARYSFSDDMLSLTIGALTAMDEGSYTLEATTIAGSDSATIILDVQTASVIISAPVDTQALVGLSATFTCVAEAEPPPTFQWSFEGSSIADDSKYDITSTSTTSTLIVLDLSPSDDGDYTCNATNDHGHDFASANLQVLSVPIVTTLERRRLGIEGRSITLSFSISEDRPLVIPANITWWFTPDIGPPVELSAASDQRYRFSNDRRSLTIQPLNLTDQGAYALVARTIAGEGSEDITLNVEVASMITEPPLDTQAYLGETAIFVCVAEAEPTPTFQWNFDGVSITDGDKYDIDTTSTTSRLTVSDITAFDDGTYNCTVENTHGRDSASANLQALSTPVVTAIPQSPLIGIVASSITLRFSVTNDLPLVTPADITWLFTPVGGSEIPISANSDTRYTFSSDLRSLTITALALADEGDYDLVVSTIAGNASDNISLDIQVPARITTPPVATEVIMGRNATFSCGVVAEPAATFQWTFGGSVIEENEKYDIATTNPTTSTLTLLDVSTSDNGIYACDVANVHGTDSASAELEVLVPPSVSVRGSRALQATQGGRITLSFMIRNTNPPVSPGDITWEFRFISDGAETVAIGDGARYTFTPDRTTLTITNLGPMDSGTYTLTAVNSAGSDAAFIQLSVSVSPTILENGGNISRSVLDESDEVAFVCTVDGVPLPTSVVWLKDGRLLQTELNDRFRVVEEDATPFSPYILSARRSTLTISNLTTSDGGRYSCSASNDVGIAVLTPAYELTVNEPEPINFCGSSPCQNGGTCSNLQSGFVCMCTIEWDGPTCEIRVIISSPPVIDDGPLAVFVFPFSPAFLACSASGTPQPVITWFMNGVVIPGERSQILSIPEPGISDRGLYHCTATNAEGTATSSPTFLNVIGFFQFRFSMRLDIGSGPFSRTEDNNVLEENLVELLNQLDGTSLGDNITLSSVEIPEGGSINPITGAFDLIITVFSDDADNSTVATVDTEVLDELSDRFENMGREQNISFTVTGVQRFDGCSVETTVILSDSSHELDVRLQWPEMPIGAEASIPCPCNSLDIPRMATRICAGDFENGGQWEDPADDDCDFSDSSRRLCLVTPIVEEPMNATTEIADITSEPIIFGDLEISILMGLLDQLQPVATGNAALSDGLFDVIDNLLKVSEEDLLESNGRTNSSGRLRELMEHLADNYPLPSGLQGLNPSFVIIRDTFAILIRLVHPDTFTGDTLSIMLGDDFDLVDAFQHGNLITGLVEDATAYIRLPSGLFEGLNLGTNEVRLVYDIYLKDTLFTRRSSFVENQSLTDEVGSIVASGRISSVEVSNLREPVELSFTKNPFARSGDNVQCSFWDQSLDNGYGGWSTEGCARVRDSSGRTACQCNHLTSFTILAEPATVNEGLGPVVGLAGGVVCIVFLLLSAIEYLLIGSLRSTTTGVFLINMCLATTVLYIFTIASFYTTSSDVLCAVFSSLFHWFFLVSALALTAAAVFRVWQPFTGKKKWLVFILAIILSWVVPAIIVAASVSPDYKNYTDDQFCRPSRFPYWLGLILPWAIAHVIAYGLLLLAFCISEPRIKDDNNNDRTAWKREQFGLLLAIVFFDIAWGFGLPALQFTESLDTSLRTAFQIVFIVFSALLGISVFLFFCLLSHEVRKKILQLFTRGRSGAFTPTAFTDQHHVKENIYALTEVDTKPGAQGESPTSSGSTDEKPSFDFVFSNPMTEEGGAEGCGGNGGVEKQKGLEESSLEPREELTHL